LDGWIAEPCFAENLQEIVARVTVAAVGIEAIATGRVQWLGALDGEYQGTSRAQRCRGGQRDMGEIAEVHQSISRNDQITRLGVLTQERGQLLNNQRVVDTAFAGQGDHGRGQVHADQHPGGWAQERPAQPGATAGIQHGELRLRSAKHLGHRVRDECGCAVVQASQGGVEHVSIAVELDANVLVRSPSRCTLS